MMEVINRYLKFISFSAEGRMDENEREAKGHPYKHILSFQGRSYFFRYFCRRVAVDGLNDAVATSAPLRTLLSSLRTFVASTLPSSTPHWSKLLIPHTKPSTTVRCSYIANNWPSTYAFNCGKRRLEEGRLPVNTLWGISLAGTFSAFSSSSVLPIARASGWAKKLDISSSWLDTTSPSRLIGFWLATKPMKSQGITRPW
mmetsp:Transcript_31668/g.51111  ORF Transcript_31668/g.51111 Transcript_31668/m.51111 type:complete len:200 (-) Transcript_31668:1211-1810(-)